MVMDITSSILDIFNNDFWEFSMDREFVALRYAPSSINENPYADWKRNSYQYAPNLYSNINSSPGRKFKSSSCYLSSKSSFLMVHKLPGIQISFVEVKFFIFEETEFADITNT